MLPLPLHMTPDQKAMNRAPGGAYHFGTAALGAKESWVTLRAGVTNQWTAGTCRWPWWSVPEPIIFNQSLVTRTFGGHRRS